jgi:hypothetical protein
MKTKRNITTALTVLMCFSMLTSASAQSSKMPTDPIGGQPPAKSKPSVKDLDYQLKYQRAFEAVLWGIPAVGIYGFEKGTKALGFGDNVILAYSGPARQKAELLTANTVTPYILAFTDLRNGPAVLELPPASEDASLFGQVVDHWQVTIANAGPSGIDKGKGGKILLTPPGYSKKIPKGYIHVKSPSYKVNFAFRSIPGPDSTVERAYEYSKTLKMYYLSELPNPKPTQFVDPIDMRFSTLPPYDEDFFDDLYQIFSVENAFPRDKVMMGMLASLGIEKGKPYNPDAKTKKAMRAAAADAFFYMKETFLVGEPDEPYYEDRQWRWAQYSDANRGFSWESDDLLDTEARALHFYHWATYAPNKLPEKPATVYLGGVLDKDGNELKAGKTYSINFPADMPVKQFWSLTIYDYYTMAFIYNKEDRHGLSSYDMEKEKKNDDGSVTLYFGPKAPKGLENYWIPTAGKTPTLYVRFYGPTDAFFDKTFKMPDIELVE